MMELLQAKQDGHRQTGSGTQGR